MLSMIGRWTIVFKDSYVCRCIVGVSLYTAHCLVLVYSPQETVRITAKVAVKFNWLSTENGRLDSEVRSVT